MAKGNITSLTEKQLEQILAKAQKYKIQTGERAKRNLDINPSVNDIHLVLRTLIEDLQKQGILK